MTRDLCTNRDKVLRQGKIARQIGMNRFGQFSTGRRLGSMEVAHHLMGITMHEAGVSRLVSVDVDKAAELAAV